MGVWNDISDGDPGNIMQNNLQQTWTLWTDQNVAAVRGQYTSSAYPLNISYIYTQADICSTANGNQAQFDNDIPISYGSTSPISTWSEPIPYTGSGQIPSGPLQSPCHWSIPIVDVSWGNGASSSCVQTYYPPGGYSQGNSNSFTFVSSDNPNPSCNVWAMADNLGIGGTSECTDGIVGWCESLHCS